VDELRDYFEQGISVRQIFSVFEIPVRGVVHSA
jgi:hypothetical protein